MVLERLLMQAVMPKQPVFLGLGLLKEILRELLALWRFNILKNKDK